MPKQTRTVVPNEVFVKELASANSLAEAAKSLDMRVGSVQARASRLRKAGVKLPKFKREAAEVDVTALNAIIAKAQKSK